MPQHNVTPQRPLLAMTMGDSNGIGPEILAQALARPEPWQYCRPWILGDTTVMEAELRRVNAACTLLRADTPEEAGQAAEGQLPITDCGMPAPARKPGNLDAAVGACVLTWIRQATQWAMDGVVDGIVTGPINKEAIHLAGSPFQGHTDFIADMTGAPEYKMCLFTDSMRIVHITGHLSLRDALDEVKQDRIVQSIRIGYEALQRMGLAAPKIAVAGLNPHAGEAGRFGREEIEEIQPAVETCQAEGIPCSGPYPPDTLFGRMRAGDFDMVIAMYHDQGHIPLKLIAMDEGVNVTLGIPIVRTSVDHGTAFDIAGKGIALEDSLCQAVRFAAQLAGLPRYAGVGAQRNGE